MKNEGIKNEGMKNEKRAKNYSIQIFYRSNSDQHEKNEIF